MKFVRPNDQTESASICKQAALQSEEWLVQELDCWEQSGRDFYRVKPVLLDFETVQ